MLAELKRIVLDAVGPYRAEVYLIGSFARGDVRQWSDVDVAIDGSKIPTRAWARLEEDVDQSTIPRRVELIDLTETDEAFRRRVRAEGVRWSA
jgi:hypothetical protein